MARRLHIRHGKFCLCLALPATFVSPFTTTFVGDVGNKIGEVGNVTGDVGEVESAPGDVGNNTGDIGDAGDDGRTTGDDASVLVGVLAEPTERPLLAAFSARLNVLISTSLIKSTKTLMGTSQLSVATASSFSLSPERTVLLEPTFPGFWSTACTEGCDIVPLANEGDRSVVACPMGELSSSRTRRVRLLGGCLCGVVGVLVLVPTSLTVAMCDGIALERIKGGTIGRGGSFSLERDLGGGGIGFDSAFLGRNFGLAIVTRLPAPFASLVLLDEEEEEVEDFAGDFISLSNLFVVCVFFSEVEDI